MSGLRVSDLLASGRLEAVPADQLVASVRLGRARHHLTTAATLVAADGEVAYTALYDAARKAVTAHMLANGMRGPIRPGSP